MALKAIIKQEAYDELDDLLKAEYVEDGDVFKLDVTSVGGFALEDVGGLKKTASSERAARKKAEAALDAYKDDDGELLDAADARAAILARSEGNPEDVDKQIAEAVKLRDADLKKRHAQEMEKITKHRDSVVALVSKTLLSEGALAAISRANGKPALLSSKLLSESRSVENSDGVFVLEILDEAGNPRTGSGPDGNMTFDERLEELKNDEDWGAAFNGSGQSGSGDRNSDNRGGGGGGSKSYSRSDVMRDTSGEMLKEIQSGTATFSD